MAERIPVRGALHRHVDGVVGITDARNLVIAPGGGVGAGRQHGMDRIPAAAEQTGLRAAAVERNAERENLAGPDQAGGAHDVFGRDVIERADLVVLAPAAPILEPVGGFGDGRAADGDVHSPSPSSSVFIFAYIEVQTPHTGRGNFGGSAMFFRSGGQRPPPAKRCRPPPDQKLRKTSPRFRAKPVCKNCVR